MIDVVKKAVVKAGERVLQLRQKGLFFRNKKRSADFTTDADISSEEIILGTLQKNFPSHNFVSEEAGKILNDSEYTWYVDPLDGTIPFSSGMPSFGISVGLVKGNTPILGVVNLPELKSLYWAEKGRGAYLDGKMVKVSREGDLLKCVIGVEYAYVGMRVKEAKKLLIPIIDKVRYTPALGSTVVGTSYVASGVMDAYIHTAHPWDFCATAVIVTEAGGKVTDFKGKPLNWSKDWLDVVASNGLIHDKIIELINR